MQLKRTKCNERNGNNPSTIPAKKRTLVSLKSIFRPDMPSGGRLKPMLGDESDVLNNMTTNRRNMYFSGFMQRDIVPF
jgi:hypothetical protein